MKRLILLFFLIVFTFLINLSAQIDCGTRIKNYSYSMNDAVFLNDTTIIVIGDDGLIMKSNNLGERWEKINSGTDSYLSKIQFLNPKVGYILGSYDFLLRTDDGGDKWFKIPINNTDYTYLTDLYFQSPDTGFVVGEEGKIFKTFDGGRNWEYQKNGFDDFSSVVFINDSIGFISGRSNTLLKTIDLGNTWVNIDMDDLGWNLRFMDIVFTSEDIGYILENDGEIFKTSNQGTSWSEIVDIPTDFATNIYFVDENIGYVIGGWATLYKTIDGGENWERVNYSSTGTFSGIALNKTGAKGIVVGDAAGYGSTSESGHIMLLSENNGENWEILSFLNGDNYFYDIAFLEDSIGYIFGGSYLGNGSAFKTYNKGYTWNKLDINANSNIRDCYFIDKDTGFISIAVDSLYRTVDGGESWSVLPGVKTSHLLGDKIHFFNSERGIYVDVNNILKTSNFGKSWDTVALSNYWIMDIDFYDDSLGLAVGYKTGMLTRDGGNTWSIIDSLSNDYNRSVFFVSDKHIFVGGNDGVLHQSTDGGITWLDLNSKIPTDIVDLFFYNDSIGVAITNNDGGIGEIYHSYDSGLSWTRIKQVLEDIYKYADVDNGHGFIIGDRGVLQKIDPYNSPIYPSYIIGDTLVVKDSANMYSLLSYDGEITNWISEDDNIIDITNDSVLITWQNSGYYSIAVSLENGCGISSQREFIVHVVDSIIVESNSISDNVISENHLLVFPNPTSDFLNISFEYEKEDYSIRVINSFGATMINETKNGFSRINITKLESGVYYLVIDSRQNRYISKIIKK